MKISSPFDTFQIFRLFILSSARNGFPRSDRPNLESSSTDSSLLGWPVSQDTLVLSSRLRLNIVAMFDNLSTRLFVEYLCSTVRQDTSMMQISRVIRHRRRRRSFYKGKIRCIVSASLREKIYSFTAESPSLSLFDVVSRLFVHPWKRHSLQNDGIVMISCFTAVIFSRLNWLNERREE